jgi:hypothetical protein
MPREYQITGSGDLTANHEFDLLSERELTAGSQEASAARQVENRAYPGRSPGMGSQLGAYTEYHPRARASTLTLVKKVSKEDFDGI